MDVLPVVSSPTEVARGREVAGNPVALLARKEAAELIASPRGLAWLATLAAGLSAFSLLFVASTELSLLDNAEAVYMMLGVVTGLAALLAVVIGNDTLAGERDRGSLLPLLATPLSPRSILLGKLAGLAGAWLISLIIATPYLWAVGSTGQNLLAAAVALLLLGTPLVLSYGLLAMALGARPGASRGSLMVALIILLTTASPLVLGPSLRQSLLGRMFDWINPFANVLNAFDLVVIDSQGVSSQALHWGIVMGWFLLAYVATNRAVNRLSV